MTPDQVMADAKAWPGLDPREESGREAMRSMLRGHIVALTTLAQKHYADTKDGCPDSPICMGADAWVLGETMDDAMPGHDKMMVIALVLELADAWSEVSRLGVMALDVDNRLRHADVMIAELSKRLAACEEIAAEARPYLPEEEV